MIAQTERQEPWKPNLLCVLLVALGSRITSRTPNSTSHLSVLSPSSVEVLPFWFGSKRCSREEREGGVFVGGGGNEAGRMAARGGGEARRVAAEWKCGAAECAAGVCGGGRGIEEDAVVRLPCGAWGEDGAIRGLEYANPV